MATMVRRTRVGFDVTGLRAQWRQIDFQQLATQIGAFSVDYLDTSLTGLRVVCRAEKLEAAIKQLVDIIKADGRFTARQRVSFTYLEENLLLVTFSDGIPHDVQLLPASSMGIERVAYGEQSLVLKGPAGTSSHAWHRAVQDVWIKLTHLGAVPTTDNPYVNMLWPKVAPGGQIIVVDPGMIIVESADVFTEISEGPFHPPLPAEIIGTRYYVIGAYTQWPPAVPRDELTHDRIEFYLEIGRMRRGLIGGDFLDADAPIIFHEAP